MSERLEYDFFKEEQTLPGRSRNGRLFWPGPGNLVTKRMLLEQPWRDRKDFPLKGPLIISSKEALIRYARVARKSIRDETFYLQYQHGGDGKK